MRRLVGFSGRNRLRRAHHQASMLNTLGADEPIGESLHVFGFATQHDDFEAILVIEMGVHSRNDDVVVLVLNVGKFFRKQARVMIVDERHGADDESVRSDNGRVDQALANQIAKGFGAIFITLVGDKRIEAAKQVGVNRYADTAEISH